MDPNFYENLDLRYPEIAILDKEINCSRHDSPLGEFQIPVLTPYTASDTDNVIRTKPNNLMNVGDTTVGNCVLTNTIKIRIPNYIISSFEEPIVYKSFTSVEHSHNITGSDHSHAIGTNNHKHQPEEHHAHSKFITIPKNTVFIVVFLGGDINQPKIIGLV